MDWTQVLTIIISNFAFFASNLAMFMWARSEARHDQQEIREIIRGDQQEVRDIIRSIQEEMKDFHARLCVIAETKRV